MTTTPIRVRALLTSLNGMERAALKKLLPRGVATAIPEEPEGTRYPAALIAQLPKGESYALAGHITEELLHYPPVAITNDLLTATVRKWAPDITETALGKITASKTTEPYLAHVRATRIKVRSAAIGDFEFEPTVGGPIVEGHPDMRTPTQIFEIKMTGQLKQNWVDFLFQVFAYAALVPAIKEVYLVLPLQEILWRYDVSGWAARSEYRTALETAATKKSAAAAGGSAALIAAHHIGCHMSKQKSLEATIRGFPVGAPHQIFLSGPQSSRLSIPAAELAAAAVAVKETGAEYYIHSAYLINLCTPAGTDDDYHTVLLKRTLEYGVAAGARGVVVHVGKSVKQAVPDAMVHMRANTLAAIESATAECPLLLETPAGQGTEVLRTWEEFVGFVCDINDPRLRICIDTCHVFAAGHDPVEYLRRLTETYPALPKLCHFNDSATPCGSCLDRHALVGEGHIGLEGMTAIAEIASAHRIPMVIEQ